MDNIILIGMPAAGKSTIGVVIAKRLGYQFVDTDILIQEEEGKLLKDIIAEKGIDGFLEVEDRVNAKVDTWHTVISPGGIVCQDRTIVQSDSFGGKERNCSESYSVYSGGGQYNS